MSIRFRGLRHFAALLLVLLLSGASTAARAAGPALSGAAPIAPFGAGWRAFDGDPARVVGVYVPNWESPALLDRLAPGSLTHALYAFLRICGPGQLPKDAAACAQREAFQLAVTDTEKTFDAAFVALKQRLPALKVVASVGGWGGSDPFFHFANEPARRAVFVDSAVAFLRAHPAFDGIDIDWEHPTSNGSANGVALGAPEDGQGYAALMIDLRRAVDALGRETGRRYLVTSAVNTTDAIVRRIDFRRAAPALDLLFMMTYDFYGGWSASAGHHAALLDGRPGTNESLAGAVKALTDAGMPKAKLVAGVAMYGRGFSGVVPPRRGASFNGAKKTGPFPPGEGVLTWREIAALYVDTHGRGRGGFQVVQDPVTQGYALWNPATRRYLGYDDPRAVMAKGAYARREGLAGVFAWELSQDNGDLLDAMNRGMGKRPR
ncbi:glycoside hydrolase family 18 protein [Aquabacterium humicola]|uniref:glycoside hydrolase family 18 protein n=1 Tax=Aquabacterium humicola TaxID=3237377 RepID=UPI002543283F|nr:glycoside hydrolase family 18 protein [Rubrivivax pictus]